MKRILLVGAAALIAGAAYAQTSTTQQTTTTTTTTLQPEVRTKVRQYVTTNKPRAVTAPSGFQVSVGATLPEAVELETFPADVGVTQYRYVGIGGRTVLVEPGSRRIIEVFD
jgi:hypothetical protein